MREGTSERDQGGDVVVITGAASGIGEALAIALSREWAIVGCDLPQRLAGLQKTASEHGFRAVAADITSPVDVERLFGTAVQEGVLRGVVNCAGVGQRAYLSETTPESFDRLVDVNLKGTFLVMREAFLTLRRHRAPGSIVAVSSINAAAVFPSQAVYSAAKAGVNSLVAAAAVEGGPYGIRANALAPGSTRTAGMNPHAGENPLERQAIPMRRVGYPVDMVGPVRFLLSEESAYVTGCVLSVDGGLTHVRGGYAVYEPLVDSDRRKSP